MDAKDGVICVIKGDRGTMLLFSACPSRRLDGTCRRALEPPPANPRRRASLQRMPYCRNRSIFVIAGTALYVLLQELQHICCAGTATYVLLQDRTAYVSLNGLRHMCYHKGPPLPWQDRA